MKISLTIFSNPEMIYSSKTCSNFHPTEIHFILNMFQSADLFHLTQFF